LHASITLSSIRTPTLTVFSNLSQSTCQPVRLFACSPVRLFGCSPVRLFACSLGKAGRRAAAQGGQDQRFAAVHDVRAVELGRDVHGEVGAAEGVVEQGEAELLEGVFHFGDRRGGRGL